MEKWKQCEESSYMLYFISNHGRLKSISKVGKKEKILKTHLNRLGYYEVKINNITTRIHVLVCKAFLGIRPIKHVVDHIDRNRANNKIENLRYCSSTINNRNTSRFIESIKETDSKIRQKITGKLWRDNIMDKEKEKERCRLKYIKNKEEQLAKQSVKYTCKCGSVLTTGKKARHEKSKKHLIFI